MFETEKSSAPSDLCCSPPVGFFKGVGQAAVGVVVKPLAGAAGAVSAMAGSVGETLPELGTKVRLRSLLYEISFDAASLRFSLFFFFAAPFISRFHGVTLLFFVHTHYAKTMAAY